MEEYKFKDPYGKDMNSKEVIEEIASYMKQGPNYGYKVIIGTDSEAINNNDADFVTAIVVHRVGNGGRYFWRRIRGEKFFTMRDRIIHEVVISLEIAQGVLKNLQEALQGARWDFEIHADVGDNGPTNVLIQEVTGMIRANDFEPKTKPESFAASSVADRYC
jgi:hypothetical protein